MTNTNAITLTQLLPALDLPEAVSNFAISVEAQFWLDSRCLRVGDVFVALPSFHGVHDMPCESNKRDGRNFIEAAINAGAALVLSQADGGVNVSTLDGVPVVSVPHLADQLSELAGRFYGHPSRELLTVGITGTNGKTTCSQLLARVFEFAGKTSAVMGTLGAGLLNTPSKTGFTTPQATQCQHIIRQSVDAGAELIAIEVSSHALEQGRVSNVQLDATVFTNLSRDHLDYHGSMENYGAAKARLFTDFQSRVQVINVDDSFGAELYRQLQAKPVAEQLLSVSSQQESSADISVLDKSFTPSGIGARVLSPWGEFTLEAPLFGGFNLDNCLAVFATACALGLEPEIALTALKTIVPVPGRMESVSSKSNVQVIVDFAHTPDALEQALSALKLHQQTKLTCVVGCGGDRDQGKRAEMAAVAERLADHVWLTSDNPRSEDPKNIIDHMLAGISDTAKVSVELDRAQAIAQAIAQASSNDCVLIAGKGHETEQIFADYSIEFSDFEHAKKALEVRA